MKGFKILLATFLVIALIFTGNFPKKVAAETTELKLTQTTNLYSEPLLTKNSYAALAPQTVTVIEKRNDGWYKIKTWIGDMWIAPYGVKLQVTQYNTLFDSPSFTSKRAEGIAPQTVTAYSATPDGWYKINTWLGAKWIAPFGVKVQLRQQTTLYNTPSFNSNSGASLAPQVVTAVDGTQDGWQKIKTWLGEKWIAPTDGAQHLTSPSSYLNYLKQKGETATANLFAALSTEKQKMFLGYLANSTVTQEMMELKDTTPVGKTLPLYGGDVTISKEVTTESSLSSSSKSSASSEVRKKANYVTKMTVFGVPIAKLQASVTYYVKGTKVTKTTAANGIVLHNYSPVFYYTQVGTDHWLENNKAYAEVTWNACMVIQGYNVIVSTMEQTVWGNYKGQSSGNQRRL